MVCIEFCYSFPEAKELELYSYYCYMMSSKQIKQVRAVCFKEQKYSTDRVLFYTVNLAKIGHANSD